MRFNPVFSALLIPLMAAPCLAEQVIRPSKLLNVELAQPIPNGSHLLLLTSGDLQYAYGIGDRFQLEAAGSSLSLAPSFEMPWRIQGKTLLWQGAGFSFGAGAGLEGKLSGSLDKCQFFFPLGYTLTPNLTLGLVPRVSSNNNSGAKAGAGLGLGWGHGDYYLMAEAHALDAQNFNDYSNNSLMLGAAYFGFGPRTTMAAGMTITNTAVSVFEALGVGF